MLMIAFPFVCSQHRADPRQHVLELWPDRKTFASGCRVVVRHVRPRQSAGAGGSLRIAFKSSLAVLRGARNQRKPQQDIEPNNM
jgi:hypothetical protein